MAWDANRFSFTMIATILRTPAFSCRSNGHIFSNSLSTKCIDWMTSLGYLHNSHSSLPLPASYSPDWATQANSSHFLCRHHRLVKRWQQQQHKIIPRFPNHYWLACCRKETERKGGREELEKSCWNVFRNSSMPRPRDRTIGTEGSGQAAWRLSLDSKSRKIEARCSLLDEAIVLRRVKC